MSTLQPSSFEFLKDLARNNNKAWFEGQKSVFKEHQDNFKALVQEVKVGMEHKDQIEKSKVFRIYRDVRFSKDKTPYKSHLAASFTRMGAERRGGYYLHLKPGESFIAVGFWAPNKEDIFRIRKEFEMDITELEEILSDTRLKKAWGSLQGEQLKTAPKGFDRDHPNIEYLRYKQFIFTRKFTDKEVFSPNFGDKVVDSYEAIRPFFDYMSDVLTTNLNGESLL
jgi:uncharacterized protein (TIGR02453 family)